MSIGYLQVVKFLHTGLGRVMNVRRGDSGTRLQWSAPANAPDECILRYRIDVDGVPVYTTSDDETSITLAAVPDLESCGDYEVTVTPVPVVPSIGAVEMSTSDPYNSETGTYYTNPTTQTA